MFSTTPSEEGENIPEGPELAYARDRLKQLIEGKRLVAVGVGSNGRYSKKHPEGYDAFVEEAMQSSAGPMVSEIATKGKFMWWKLLADGGATWYMWITYGMSGGWYTSSSRHAALSVGYNDSGIPITRDVQSLFFNDPRHFGTVKFVRSEADHRKKLSTLGPCILGGLLTPEIFAENSLKKQARTISEALMDQRVAAGVGNYIKAEALYRAGISPWRVVTDVSAAEYVSLCRHVIDVAKSSYSSQGATISTYRTVDGTKGTTQFDFQVYSRKTCPKGHAVLREQTPEGRTSHWCNICQS